MKKHSQKISEHVGLGKLFYSVNGWGGAILILVAYFLVSFSIVSPQGMLYQVLNIAGSVGLTLEAFSKRDQPRVVLNAIWALIAIVAVARVVLIHL